MIGVHPAKEFTLDLFALFIPGGHWRFAQWTEAYWSKLPGNINESSVHIGISVSILLAYVWWKRKHIQLSSLRLWYLIFIFFTVMSLGPVFHVWGKEVSSIPMPYTLMEHVIPPLRMSGVPIRMTVMTVLCASVISAAGFQRLLDSKSRWIAVLLILLCFEYLPKPIPASRIRTPASVKMLKWLPGEDGVLDLAHGQVVSLYNQTIHQKPMAFGYIARVPSSVAKEDRRISRLIRRRRFGTLCREFNFRYLLAKAKSPKPEDGLTARALFKGPAVTLYDLGPNGECEK